MEKTTTPNPQDEEIGEGNFVFAEGTVEGRRERANKQTEIDSNRNGYGTSGPTPVADEKDSGGPVYDTGNHDDGGNHVKQWHSPPDVLRTSLSKQVVEPPILMETMTAKTVRSTRVTWRARNHHSTSRQLEDK